MRVRWATAMLDLPGSAVPAGTSFWSALTGSTLSPWRGADAEYATFEPAEGDAFLRVQRFEGGPRVHLDLHVGDEAAVRSACVRALALGAALEHDAGTHVVLSSPGGYVFCIVRDAGHARRPPAVGGVLVDQLCLGVPGDRFDAEVAFWSALTGWAALPGSGVSFVPLERPAGMPLRIMLHRWEPGVRRPVEAHLDLACRSRASAERAHVAAGAEVVARHERWTTLMDPVGQVYCLTDRDPGTGLLPAAGLSGRSD